MLPADVSVVRVTYGGQETLEGKEELEVEVDLARLVAETLAQRGFEVRAVSVTASESPALRFQAEQIQSAYDGVRGVIWAPSTAANGTVRRCDLGPAVRSLASRGADAVVFVRLSGFMRSGGSIAGEAAPKILIMVAGGVAAQNPIAHAELEAALVDAATGELLWANRTSRDYWGYIPVDYDERDLAKLVDELFEPFPENMQ